MATIQAATRRRRFELTPARITSHDLMHLSRQLAAFLQAGISILDAIGVIGEDSDNPAVRQVFGEIGADLRSGLSLSEAFDRHPRDFPDWYRGMLRAAELTGRLDGALAQLATYIERDVEARRKLKAAMIYPAIICVMAICTTVVLSVVVLPKFEDFFASLNATLPLATRMLLGATRFLSAWWWLLATAAAGVGLLGVGVARTEAGRYGWDRLVLSLPVVGETVRYSKVERFTRLLASMVTAGVSLPLALEVTTASLHSRVFERALDVVGQAMLRGEGLSAQIAATGLFPGVAAQMIRVGEDTGTLAAQLELSATFYGRELDYKIAKVTAVIEPLVITVMGAVVGFVAVALVSAMYGIFRSANLG